MNLETFRGCREFVVNNFTEHDMVKDEGYRRMILNVLLMYDDKSRPTKLRNFKPMSRTYPWF